MPQGAVRGGGNVLTCSRLTYSFTNRITCFFVTNSWDVNSTGAAPCVNRFRFGPCTFTSLDLLLWVLLELGTSYMSSSPTPLSSKNSFSSSKS